MNALWPRIRAAARYEDINWSALGLGGAPGTEAARSLTSAHWATLRGAARFSDINWSALRAAAQAPAPAARGRDRRARTADAPAAEQPQTAATPRAPAAGGITGSWVGAYQRYPEFLQMTLEIAAPRPDGLAEVRVSVEPFAGQTRTAPTTARVLVRYDAVNDAATFDFGSGLSTLQIADRELYAFLDREHMALAGIMPNAPGSSSPFFVLTRPRDADGAVLDPIHDAHDAQGGLPAKGYDRRTLEQWAQKFVDEYPNFDTRRPETGGSVINLFGDEHFSAHFGVTFDRMSARDRKRVTAGIRDVPMPRAGDPQGRTAYVLRSAERSFSQMLGTHAAAEAVLSTLAIRHFGRWRASTMNRLEGLAVTAEGYRTADTIDLAGSRQAPYLWPSERAAFAEAVDAALARTAVAPLEQRVQGLLAGATNEAGVRALRDALSLSVVPAVSRIASALRGPPPPPPPGARPAQPPEPGSTAPSLAELASRAPATWASLQPRMNAGLDSALAALLDAERSAAGLAAPVAADPLARLRSSTAWYQVHRGFIDEFASRRVVADFMTAFAEQREADIRAALPALAERLEGITAPGAARQLAREIEIDLDTGSRAWQELDTLRTAHAAQLERAALVARVGQGPFGPDYPGAVYLNALYRNDRALMEEEDRSVSATLIAAIRQINNLTGFGDVITRLMGRAAPPGGYMAMFGEQANRYTIAAPLTAFFVVAYEEIYPQCMDADPVEFSRTVVTETIWRNGLGFEVSRSPPVTETTRWRVNRRHAAAFRAVGAGEDPEQIAFTGALYGLLFPGVGESTQRVSQTVRGLRRAMSDNACDSALIRQLERNMIDRAMSR